MNEPVESGDFDGPTGAPDDRSIATGSATMINGGPAGLPGVLRRLDTPGAATLVDLNAKFEDLQMVLRCCDWLMAELNADSVQPDGVEPDGVVVEAVWTVALLSYGRCFAVGMLGTALGEDDLTAIKLGADVLDWHKVLLQLRDHYADATANPRERFSVVVTQDDSTGKASGIGITSARQPMVDQLTVRQTGGIAFALSRLVNDRITTQQAVVFAEVQDTPKKALDKLVRLEVASKDAAR